MALGSGGHEAEHVDVLIVGAGLSGIGAACHLRMRRPSSSFLILESREAIGGTWDLFRYPGVRSDSDMFTLGYAFRPWSSPRAIADGAAIREYISSTASEFGVRERIRFGLRAVRARWNSASALWEVEARRTGTQERVLFTCSFLHCCTGYYSYERGHTPRFEGAEEFEGAVIHPQSWPEGLDCAGQRVVVIGSGATAVTLVPALAERAAHVTMLQRSPSYVLSVPSRDALAERALRRLPARTAYELVRWKNVLLTMLSYGLCRRAPRLMRHHLIAGVRRQLPADCDVERHFNPSYDPWDERLCLVPDGDLFGALADGRASVLTGEIERFTPRGIRLRSGEELEADVIVTATGLELLMLGGLELRVDDVEIDVGESVVYKGMMLCGVPNMAFTVGYTNASWTLKADLVCEYVCRLLAHMEERGARVCVPVPPRGQSASVPILDLKSGYVMRALARLPKQGQTPPWRLHQNYVRDLRLLRHGSLDEAMEFSCPAPSASERELAAAA